MIQETKATNNILIDSRLEFINLLKQTKEKDEILIIYFFASWCGPCKSFGPIYEAVSKKQETNVMKKIDIDHVESVATDYGIQSIPTLIAFKNGQEIDRCVGVPSNLNTWLQELN